MGDVMPVEDVILHEQEGEAFLLHVPSGRYFGLNRSGLVVWKALASGDDPDAAVAGHWPDVAPDARRADVAGVIDSLIAAGLARRSSAPAPG